MNPSEMQAIIDRLRWDLHNLCMMATEPGQTPVHPKGTVDRDKTPITKQATGEEVGATLAEF